LSGSNEDQNNTINSYKLKSVFQVIRFISPQSLQGAKERSLSVLAPLQEKIILLLIKFIFLQGYLERLTNPKSKSFL
jgi:hypothetical protein